MNCAMPCAPAGLITRERKELSFQMSFVKNSRGICRVLAASSISLQKACSTVSEDPVDAQLAPQLMTNAQSARRKRMNDRSDALG
jgi:hypothetical protein